MLAQLEAAPLLRRLELASDKVLRARGALAPRADAASGAGSSRHGVLGFANLPHTVALHVLSFVPADARARSALVCRFWRDTVADAKLWTALDLSPASGVAQPVTDAMLRGAAALARGGLEALCLDGCDELPPQETLVEVVVANAGSLRQLSFASLRCEPFDVWEVEELMSAAPQLVAFKVDVSGFITGVTAILRNEAFVALQLHELRVYGPEIEEGDAPLDEADVRAFRSAVSAHVSLRQLSLVEIPLDALDVTALCSTVLALRLVDLKLDACDLSLASVPALAQLIRGGALKSLGICSNWDPLLDDGTAVQLAEALAASRTLTRLELSDILFWDNATAAAIVMRALTGHPHLRVLDLTNNHPPDPLAAGAALGALVAANTPALEVLKISNAALGDAGLGPLFAVLPHNNHLRKLRCYNTGMSEAFARDVLLPAVRANTSLRKLDASRFWGGQGHNQPPPALLEAEALVAARKSSGSKMTDE